jgi:hypothetical protein
MRAARITNEKKKIPEGSIDKFLLAKQVLEKTTIKLLGRVVQSPTAWVRFHY